MGYRSSVYFKISDYADFHASLTDEVAKRKLDMGEVDSFLADLRQPQFPDQHIYFHEYVKWYADLDAVVTVVDEVLKEKECLFVRVGENTEDVEYCGDSNRSDEHIYIRTVSCAGTEDALAYAMTFLNDIERGTCRVRSEAMQRLTTVLNKLRAVDGLPPIEEQ